MLVFTVFGFLLYHISWFIPNKFRNSPDVEYDIYGPMSDWINISWFDFGLIRRALIGTILYPFSDEYKYIAFICMMCSALIIIIGGLYYLYKKSNYSSSAILLLFSLSPLGAMQLGWCFGRFEYLNYSIIILFLLLKDRLNNFVISCLLSMGVLIHEAFIFYGWPIIAVLLIQTKCNKNNGWTNYLEIIGIFFMPICIALWLLFFGNLEAHAMGASRGIFEIPTCYFLTTNNLIPYISYLDIFSIYVVSIFYIITIFFFQRNIYKLNKQPLDLMFLAPFFCLFLYMLGVDYMRWTGIMFFLVCLTILYRYANNEFHTPVTVNRSLLIQLVILGFPFFGPIGIINPFPCLRNLLIMFNKIFGFF